MRHCPLSARVPAPVLHYVQMRKPGFPGGRVRPRSVPVVLHTCVSGQAKALARVREHTGILDRWNDTLNKQGAGHRTVFKSVRTYFPGGIRQNPCWRAEALSLADARQRGSPLAAQRPVMDGFSCITSLSEQHAHRHSPSLSADGSHRKQQQFAAF